ncbi:MAG TPA: ABC transporter ATP-binding protein [Gemmatimonadaceae bacterium]|jgi:ABC-2 type transport system ATP-binding protein|nr:ABC transporter ATP-binding protein [Gemmatimonadaceae bacterium]
MTQPLPTTLQGANLAVSTRALRKRFGTVNALDGLDLQVPTGAVYLLIGPNGAGKSTALRTLLDLVRADAGSASVFDLDTIKDGPRIRANIGYVPERTEWGYPWMRVGQLLLHHSAYFPSWDAAYAARLITLFELQLDRKLGGLSKGQARRVHLVVALAHRPPLLLLDEPIDGLDPIIRDETLSVLAEHFSDTPTTTIISTHHVSEVESMVDCVGAMRAGTLRAQLSLADLRAGLRRYRAEVPDGWAGAPALNGAVLRRAHAPREIQWTAWGPEAEISAHLTQAGAAIRDVAAVSLNDATLALLNPKADQT